jgi:hypothetical protein
VVIGWDNIAVQDPNSRGGELKILGALLDVDSGL